MLAHTVGGHAEKMAIDDRCMDCFMFAQVHVLRAHCYEQALYLCRERDHEPTLKTDDQRTAL